MKLQIMQGLLGLKLAHGRALRFDTKKNTEKNMSNMRGWGLKNAVVDDIWTLGDVFCSRETMCCM